MSPMIKAYQFHDHDIAANLLYAFNQLLKPYECGVKDLPRPKHPDMSDVMDRRAPTAYFKTYFENYCPVVMTSIGKYQKDVLDGIKAERGFD